MKRLLPKLLILIFVLVIASACISACDDILPLGEKSVASLSDLDFYSEEGVSEDTVYTLTDDIVSDDFAPLNTDKNCPARGILDGNGKTVKLTVKDHDDLSVISFFGYAKDFTVKNLTLDFCVEDSVKLVTDKTVLASLIGYAVENVTVDNVTVRFSASPAMTLREYYVDDDPSPRYSSDNVQYVGGLIGVSGGKTIVSDSSVSVSVSASDNSLDNLSGRELYRKELYVGGLIAVSDPRSSTEIKSSSVTRMTVEAKADKASVGGFAAIASGCNVSDSAVEDYDFDLGFLDRIDVGGMVGSAYNASIESSESFGTISVLKSLGSSSKKTVVNLGGIAGYFYGDFSKTYDVTSSVDSCTASITASGNEIASSTARFSYGVGVLKNASFTGNTLSGQLTDVTRDDERFSSAAGDFFGEAIGSAVAENNVAETDFHYDVFIVGEHKEVSDDGEITPTLPRV